MRINKFSLVIGFAIATVLFLEVAAHADEQNQFTTFTFNKPVEIPGQILPAGTYLFKLADPDDMNLVRIFNAKGTRVYATLQTIPTERRESTGDTVVVMAEQGAGRPEALLKWFYPGRNTGNQFVYPNHEEQQLAQDRHRTILTKETAEADD
jgi:hypothetical protein